MYKQINSNSVLRISDGSNIPKDVNNTDYALYLTWLSEGNTPLPADIPPAPTYRELRSLAYPPIGDQLDAIWKGGDSEATMLQIVRAVKDKYPKE